MHSRILILLFCLAIMTSPARSQDIEADIIQLKLDRVFFGTGSEAGIYVGSPFIIECDDSLVLEGLIDYAGPGISYSRPVARLDTLRLNSACPARISISRVDSNAVITLGTDLPLRLFDPEHETLFIRQGDSVIGRLIDSSRIVGNTLDLYLPAGIRFSDGSRFDAMTLAECFTYMKTYGQSYLTRYFFSKLFPVDSGGIELLDAFSLRLRFYHPLPRAEYFLSHPDFAVSAPNGRGTGPLVEIDHPGSGDEKKSFIVNRFYHGDRPMYHKLIVTYYRQSFRMRFAFDAGLLDACVGFGFDDVLAGSYQAEALYPEVAVMMTGIGGEAFFQAMFAISLYYRFDPGRSHLYFPDGETVAIDRWLVGGDSSASRYYPFDFLKGNELQSTLTSLPGRVHIVYDDSRLSETARFLADIAAREGTAASVRTANDNGGYDIKVAFLSASDKIMPFALLGAVLDINDQDAALPPGDRLDRPGWAEADRGSRLYEPDNRRTFFSRAEEVLTEDCGSFPLYRPRVYGVAGDRVKNLGFDFYGFPIVHRIVKLQRVNTDTDSKGTP